MDIIQFMTTELSIYEKIRQHLKFTLFSLSAEIVQVVSLAIFNDVFKRIYLPSYLSALILSIIWNFTLNRQFL